MLVKTSDQITGGKHLVVFAFPVSKARHQVVVDHPGGLQTDRADAAAEKPDTSLLFVPADLIR